MTDNQNQGEPFTSIDSWGRPRTASQDEAIRRWNEENKIPDGFKAKTFRLLLPDWALKTFSDMGTKDRSRLVLEALESKGMKPEDA